MALTDISSYHIGANPELYQPAVSNAFQFIISDELNKLLCPGTDNNNDANYLQNVQDIIKISVVSSSVPHYSLGEIELRRGNSTVYFAGSPSFTACELKLDDFVGARTKDALIAWQSLAYNIEEDRVQEAKNYKFDCTLVEYSVDFKRIIRKWTLVGCWIKDISESAFEQGAADKRTIQATVRYDRAIPEAVL